MLRKLILTLSACLVCALCGAQIVNRLRVDQDTFLRYAYCRMQQFNPENLTFADSLYAAGVQKDDFRYKCLALSLEMPVRFAEGDYARMGETAGEVKTLLEKRKDCRDFYFTFINEYCEYLVHIGDASTAMLEARAMERMATEERRPLGKMYAYSIIGLIQSSRENHYLAVQNMEKAVNFSREARAEQELPSLYILLAQENIKMKQFTAAGDYVSKAEDYERFFPSIRLKAQNQMTILIGFLVMFVIAFFAILLSQWQLRENMDELRQKNNQMLDSRRAFQKALDTKESENEYKIKILQNRKTNILRL